MEPSARAVPRGFKLLAVSGTLGLLATGGLVMLASSGTGTPGAPGVKTPVQSNARDAATRRGVAATSTTAEPAAPTPAASPTGAASGSVVPSAPAGSGDASAEPISPQASVPSPPAMFVLVCQTPVVIVDGIETSSQVATRVPEGTPIPAGCYRA